MKILLATGIYPPDIGGPATYVRRLARELTERGDEVTVITYTRQPATQKTTGRASSPHSAEETALPSEPWRVIRVSFTGGPLLRWRRYAKALQKHGKDADIIECFSSVSVGIPLRMAKLSRPRKILRLGGDFTWERYTDMGRRRTLRAFMIKYPRLRFPMAKLLQTFDHVIFSTKFQAELYTLAYRTLPRHSVIQNALPALPHESEGTGIHQKHDPLRLLFFGRFVKFKNLDRLLRAVAGIPHAVLTLVGEGPERDTLLALARTLQMQGRIAVVPPVHGEEVQNVFAQHDVLVIPSLTEISPNAALEARASGLPVLLTEENGLSAELCSGMIIRPLLTINDITKAILDTDHRYDEFAAAAAAPFRHERGWSTVAEEHVQLFQSLIRSST